MDINRIQKSLSWVIIASEASHVFCCVLPTLFSVLSFAVGMGMIAAMPAGFEQLHEMLHSWEIPMITFSGLVLVTGWGVNYAAEAIDCHESAGCGHGPCAPKKKRATKLLKFATLLFIFNVAVFLLFHHGLEQLL